MLSHSGPRYRHGSVRDAVIPFPTRQLFVLGKYRSSVFIDITQEDMANQILLS